MIKRSWFFYWLGCWLIVYGLSAQSLSITRLVSIPKHDKLAKPVSIYPTLNSGKIILTYKQNDFYIYFQALNTPPPYAFRLSGYVNYEVQTANHYAFFTNIPNGEYEFSVWSIKRPELPPAQLFLRIESPLWMRWWFLPMLFLYGLMLVGVIFYFLYRYRLRQILRLHAVRENIARDLHDDMGSYLSSISIMSQSVTNLAQRDPQRAQALVHKIGETARQVMDSMGDIIWSVNPDNDSMDQIVTRMRDAGADLLEGQDTIFNLNIDETLLRSYLPLEQRRDFFLIYKEALTNSVKYARANHIWVRLERKETALLLIIQDDGIGFDPQQSTGQNPLGGNGLKNMHTRAEKMGAMFTIVSASGQGTTVTLQIILAQ